MVSDCNSLKESSDSSIAGFPLQDNCKARVCSRIGLIIHGFALFPEFRKSPRWETAQRTTRHSTTKGPKQRLRGHYRAADAPFRSVAVRRVAASAARNSTEIIPFDPVDKTFLLKLVHSCIYLVEGIHFSVNLCFIW